MKKFLGFVSVLFFVACGDENPANKLLEDSSLSSSETEQSSSSEYARLSSSSSIERLSCSAQIVYSSSELSSLSDKNQSSSSKGELSSSSVENRALSSSNISSSNSETSSSCERESSSSVLLASSSSVSESSSSEESSSSVFVKVCGPEPASVSVEEVFENQNKAVYPDTCEYNMDIYINSGDIIKMNMTMNVITAGPWKSKTTSRSGNSYITTIQNNGRMKVMDMKTGNVLPSSYAEPNYMNFQPIIGTAEDYAGIAFEDGLWKLTPVNINGKTLYYSACEERIMKVFYVSGDSTTTMTYSYFDETANIPGVLKGLKIERSVFLRDASEREVMKSDSIRILMDWNVTSLKIRHVLPAKMFDID